ncbi:MAG: PAS domain S-box protein [Acidobacteria bacterium]|nr:PAS domain S-box protein [Acidobacteriota bacterium]
MEKQPNEILNRARQENQLEREEGRLWRWSLWLLVLLALAVALLTWERLESLPYSLGALPAGLLVLMVLFAAYAYGRKREVSELKGILRGLESRVSAVPSEDQLDQLSQVLERSQRNFKQLIDSFDEVAFAVSLDGILRTINRQFASLLGLPYAEIIGRPLDEFLDEPKRPQADKELSRFLEKRRWAGLIRVRLKASGRILHFDCVLNGIVSGEAVVGISVLARDVTHERQKETRFTELFETLQEGVYFSTPEGKLLDVNPALVEMLGYPSKEELLAIDGQALNFSQEQTRVLGRASDDRGGVRTREITLRRKDGKPAVFLDTSRAVWDPAGQIIRYQGTLVDVTERRAMERQLRQQEEFQRHLLESFPDLILVIDTDERYSFVSSRIRDLFGLEPEAWLGKKIGEIQEQSPELVELCRSVLSGKQRFGLCEYSARHGNGTWSTMRASASPLYGAGTELMKGVVVSTRNISVEKKMEQQMIQSERLAAMGQMIGGFAHELNNPLTAILGLSEMLSEIEVAETVKKQLTMIHSQARRAAEIVQNLVFYSRPPAPGRSRVNLSELVQRSLHLEAYSLRKNNISIDFQPDDSLPSVAGDPNQLVQVFWNLIVNAEQAIRELRDKGTLRIRLGRNSDSVWIVFQDDGPGIPPETLPNIFDPFYTTKRPGRGTGLGLSICRAVLREHGGRIEATSIPGAGAIFTVSLPVAAALATAASQDSRG